MPYDKNLLELDARALALASGPVITDVDDVLLDWLMGGFKPFVEQKLGKSLDPAGPNDWNMADWIGVSPQAGRALVAEFNSSIAFGRIPPFKDALEALAAAHAAGRSIHAITACATDETTVARRKANLFDTFGDIFSSITCTNLGESKKPHLHALQERLGAGIYVEDNHGHAMDSIEAGHVAFIIRRCHNRQIEQTCSEAALTWVDGWAEIRARAGF